MKLALIGYGKMGKAIEKIALERKYEILLKIDSTNPGNLTLLNLQKCDVAIEFSTPGTAPANIYACIDAGIPVICGTTGWLGELDKVKKYCLDHNSTFLQSSNFSIGVNIFFEINKRLASAMASRQDYDVSIKEIHHTQKADAPSGTAITIATDIISELPWKSRWVNKPAASKDELSVVSERIDPAPGTHVVTYHSDIDDIEIRHTAHNRKGFASGVMLAVDYLVGKKGVFSMQDVLDL